MIDQILGNVHTMLKTVVKSLGGISAKINGVAKKQMAAPVFTGTATAVRKVSSKLLLNYLILLAEGVGFEPTVRVNVQQISSLSPSAARTPLRGCSV
jgi:hypothetical protein